MICAYCWQLAAPTEIDVILLWDRFTVCRFASVKLTFEKVRADSWLLARLRFLSWVSLEKCSAKSRAPLSLLPWRSRVSRLVNGARFFTLVSRF